MMFFFLLVLVFYAYLVFDKWSIVERETKYDVPEH